MFVVDAFILLEHTPERVMRLVENLLLLPRWCGGLRRVRRVPSAPTASGDGLLPRVFTYAVADLRLRLHASTEPLLSALPADRQSPRAATHILTGDGLTLSWTLTTEPLHDGARHGAGPHIRTRLCVQVTVQVDLAYPIAAARAPLCRTVARRVPADLKRLRVLIDRYEAGRAARTAASP